MSTMSIRNTLFGLASTLVLATSSTRITSVAADVVVVDPAGVQYVQGKYVPWESELVQLTPLDAGGMSGHLYKTVNLVEFENHVKQEITKAGDASQVTKLYRFLDHQSGHFFHKTEHEIRILHAVGPNFAELEPGDKEDEAAGFETLQRTYSNIFQRFADFVGSKAGREASRETGSGNELRLSFISGGVFKGAVQDFEKKAIDAMAQAWNALPGETTQSLLQGCIFTLYTLDTRTKAQKDVGGKQFKKSQAELIQDAIAKNVESSSSSSSSVELFEKLRVESKSWSDDLASL